MTKREMFENIATINSDNAEIVAFCEHEIELLDNKKASPRGLTAVQKANLELKETILNALVEVGTAVTVTDLLANSALQGYTNQKISALLRQMVDEKKVVKTVDKKRSFFSVA